jgi:hypothetical protein
LSIERNIRQSLDLSSAVNLKSVMFHYGSPGLDVDWIAAAVESIRSSHVKEMELHMPGDLRVMTREKIETQLPDAVCVQWLALDKVLVKYLTTRSFKLKVVAPPGAGRDAFEVCAETLLPNLFGKKMLEVCEHRDLI